MGVYNCNRFIDQCKDIYNCAVHKQVCELISRKNFVFTLLTDNTYKFIVIHIQFREYIYDNIFIIKDINRKKSITCNYYIIFNSIIKLIKYNDIVKIINNHLCEKYLILTNKELLTSIRYLCREKYNN